MISCFVMLSIILSAEVLFSSDFSPYYKNIGGLSLIQVKFGNFTKERRKKAGCIASGLFGSEGMIPSYSCWRLK
ncbi:hypothetical protein A6070_07105 [Syntrophotalea acetylenica]|nr:hypothetical protein A6070_07105 [Syntrophotalea acetylenica]